MQNLGSGVKKAPDPGSATKGRFLAVSLLVDFGDAFPYQLGN
jgi:hypothetical protein